MANLAWQGIQDSSRGDVDGGIIQAVVGALPDNNFQIPGSIHVNYEMADNDRARIDNGRAYGYFKGTIMGFPED
jgi:hypothetical protein